MIRTVKQRNANIDYRIPGQNAVFHGLTHTFFNSRNILPRYSPAENLVNKLKAFSWRQGFHLDHNVTILAMSTGLFLMLAFNLRRSADSFSVFNDRRTQIGFHTEFTFHTLHNDLDMLIAHATDQSFLRHTVLSNNDSRVLVHQTVQSSGDLLFLAFLFSVNGTSIHRQRECDRRKQNR